MATNPMQRKARNSFLLGMLTMLIIAAVIIALLFMQLINMKQQQQQEEQSYRHVYVANTDIKSGDAITIDKLTQIDAVSDVTPTDSITTDNMGLYIKSDSVAKIDLKAGTILSQQMISSSGEQVTADLRKQEYNMILLPTQLTDGEYIDIRLRMPSGKDYIVVSKKQVTIPKIAGVDSEDTIWVNLTESEILTMSNAIVEASIMTGSELYATTYVEPGMQDTAIPTYPISREIMELVNTDPNIVQEAREILWGRYQTDHRSSVNNELSQYSEEAKENIESKLEERITSQKETRKKYIDSLTAATTTVE